jgi:hypothetical protein
LLLSPLLVTVAEGAVVLLVPQYQFIGAQVMVALESVTASAIAANTESFTIVPIRASPLL